MRRQVEYAVAGLVILYIVFLTRPAPAVVSQILSNPVGHLVALGGIVYIGAFQSLLLALLLGVAYVASSPSREGVDDTMSKKCKEGEEYDTKQKKCVPKKNGTPSESKKPETPNSKTMPSPSKPISTTPPPSTTTEEPKPAANNKSQANGVSDEDPAKKEKVMPASEFETFVSGGSIVYGPY